MISCRACSGELRLVFGLGDTPLANSLKIGQFDEEEYYPLKLCVCTHCQLVQLSATVDKEILFSNYSYATPRSKSLESHYKRLNATLQYHLGIHSPALVVEIGSNTGEYLRSLPSWAAIRIGIEPAKNIAAMANESGIETWASFFDTNCAAAILIDHGRVDLVAARHCMAHVDNIEEIFSAVATILQDDGIFYFENAYVVDTLQGVQFDQIYHEHKSYIGVVPMRRLLDMHGLKIIHVERAPVHGGSIMIFATHRDSSRLTDKSVQAAIDHEEALMRDGLLDKFASSASRCIVEINSMVRSLVERGKIVDVYGASAKGSTLLNVCGLDYTFIRQALDDSELKQGKFMPGSKVPIVPKSMWTMGGYPDYALMTAWNYEAEILAAEQDFRDRGGKFIVHVPVPRVV